MVADLAGARRRARPQGPPPRGGHQRHRRGHRAARPPPRQHRRGEGDGAAAEGPGAFSFVWMDEDTLYAARDPQGIRPLVLGRLERGWVVASETAALDIVGASFIREVEPGEMVVIDEDGLRSRRFAEPAPKDCLFEFVYLARPDTLITGQRVHSVRVEIGRRLARELPGRRRPGHPGAGVRHPGRDRVRRGVRHPVRRGAGQELLRRPHLHPAEPDHPPARHPAQAEPAARRHRGQEARGGGRLDRARQHPARPDPDAPRGGCPRGARPDLLAAGEVAVLLRHRLRHPRRADRQRPDERRDLPLDRRRLARLHLASSSWSRRPRCRWTTSAAPASTASTRWRCPSRELLGKHLLEIARPSSRSTGWPPRWPVAAPPTPSSRP